MKKVARMLQDKRELVLNWFRAEGIPITPYDDSGLKNPYPLMRLIARNGSYQANHAARQAAMGQDGGKDAVRQFALRLPKALDFRWRSLRDYLRAFDAGGTAREPPEDRPQGRHRAVLAALRLPAMRGRLSDPPFDRVLPSYRTSTLAWD